MVTDARFLLFLRLWGIGAVAHVVGGYQQADLPRPAGWALLGVGLTGIALAVRPDRRLLVVLSVLIPLSALGEIPVMGNHWLLASAVSLAALLTLARVDLFSPAVRLIYLGLYSWAAFNKLNAGFFTPEVSCGLFYANQSLQASGLPVISPFSPLAWVPIVGATVIELAVPPLLLIRRTRYLGVLVASLFHIIISYDRAQHFYDFTSLLLAVFTLFLPVASADRIERVVGDIPARSRRLAAAAFTALAGLMVLAAVTPLRPQTVFLVKELPFLLWIPFSLAFLAAILRYRRSPDDVRFRTSPAALVIVALVVLNGLTPYLELKTAYGYNMYANLITAQGRSNHWVIRSTLPVRDGYDAPVEIVTSTDHGLELYRERGYLIAFPQLRRYLSTRPEVSLTFRRDGILFEVPRAGDDPILTDPGPWWWRFFPLRSLDVANPPRCQDIWLPAL
jgi:hypothetical protein